MARIGAVYFAGCDHEGRQHQWAMPMEALATEQGAVRARLLSEGLAFHHHERSLSRAVFRIPSDGSHRTDGAVRAARWLAWRHVRATGLMRLGPEGSEEILYQPPHESLPLVEGQRNAGRMARAGRPAL